MDSCWYPGAHYKSGVIGRIQNSDNGWLADVNFDRHVSCYGRSFLFKFSYHGDKISLLDNGGKGGGREKGLRGEML